jgi:hypothetical protein
VLTIRPETSNRRNLTFLQCLGRRMWLDGARFFGDWQRHKEACDFFFRGALRLRP